MRPKCGVVLVTSILSMATSTACDVDQASLDVHEPASVVASRSPIIKGSVSGTQEDAALLLMIYKGDKLDQRCTGTLVAPNLVVTARHCTAETVDQNILCTADGKPQMGGGGYKRDRDVRQMFVYTGSNAAEPAAAKATPDAVGQTLVYDTEVSNMCQGDLAFIVLDRPITKVTPAQVRLSANAQIGETLMLAGYGLTEEGQVSKQRMTRSTSVLVVGPSVQATYELSPNEIATGEGDCRGDSGGPAFDATGALVGVLSRGGGGKTKVDNAANGCIGPGATNIRTSLFALKPLVEKAFEVSGNSLSPPELAPARDEPIAVEDTYPPDINDPKKQRGISPPPPSAPPSSGEASYCAVGHSISAGDGVIALIAVVLLAWMFRASSKRRSRRQFSARNVRLWKSFRL